jgi:NADPH-dependent 2,4-dienoyl-CoA reductase/sulfur reductase-like enzyme
MHGVELIAIEGEGRVEALVLRDSRGAEKRIACDAVALGYGLKPETQLADLAGVEFAYDSDFRSWIPKMDADGRAGEALYLAGDGATIGGADAAAHPHRAGPRRGVRPRLRALQLRLARGSGETA